MLVWEHSMFHFKDNFHIFEYSAGHFLKRGNERYFQLEEKQIVLVDILFAIFHALDRLKHSFQ